MEETSDILKKITLEEVKQALDYQQITEEIVDETSRLLFWKFTHRYHEFTVHPRDDRMPVLTVRFDIELDDEGQEIYTPVRMGMSEWQLEFEREPEEPWFLEEEEEDEEFEDDEDWVYEEEDPILKAINLARKLVRGEYIVLEHRDQEGRYRRGTVIKAHERGSLGPAGRGWSVCRIQFNREVVQYQENPAH